MHRRVAEMDIAMTALALAESLPYTPEDSALPVQTARTVRHTLKAFASVLRRGINNEEDSIKLLISEFNRIHK